VVFTSGSHNERLSFSQDVAVIVGSDSDAAISLAVRTFQGIAASPPPKRFQPERNKKLTVSKDSAAMQPVFNQE